eukprot:1258179-Prymnesium_polylepis.2
MALGVPLERPELSCCTGLSCCTAVAATASRSAKRAEVTDVCGERLVERSRIVQPPRVEAIAGQRG